MDADIRDMARDIERLKSALYQRPIVAKSPSGVIHKTVYVIGGNAALIGSSLEGIQYAPDPITLSSSYDPSTDTVYQSGLGYGWLFINGVRQTSKVLIRHNYMGHPYPILAGAVCRVCGTTVLSYGGTDMTAYIFDFI